MSEPRVIVSTPVDVALLEKLDAFCEDIHRKRTEVIRGLLYSLLIEGKQFIYEEWREQVSNKG